MSQEDGAPHGIRRRRRWRRRRRRRQQRRRGGQVQADGGGAEVLAAAAGGHAVPAGGEPGQAPPLDGAVRGLARGGGRVHLVAARALQSQVRAQDAQKVKVSVWAGLPRVAGRVLQVSSGFSFAFNCIFVIFPANGWLHVYVCTLIYYF